MIFFARRTSLHSPREATSTEVQDLRRENRNLKQVVAETVLENRVLKKSAGRRLGGRYVRLTAAEKHETIRLVEGADRRSGIQAARP